MSLGHYIKTKKERCSMTEKIKTTTRSEIAQAIHNELGFSHADGFKLLDETLALIVDSFKEGKEVKISGFATFEPHSKRERIGRNPKTGEAYPISARTTVVFKPSNELKKNLK